MTAAPAAKPALTLMLASPRGFCAGVDRAIQIVERAIAKVGARGERIEFLAAFGVEGFDGRCNDGVRIG